MPARNATTDQTDRRIQALRRAAIVFVVALWLMTFAVGLGWLLGWPLPFDPNPVVLVLGLISGGVTGLLNAFANLLADRQAQLEEERYSTAYALAYGYVNNFLEPALTQLLASRAPGEGPLQLCVYIPDELEELTPPAIERTLARIREQDFRVEYVKLDFREGLARNVLTVMRERGGRRRYFDFPTTLLTLVSLVDYKAESGKTPLGRAEKQALGARYIDQFRAALERLAARKQLSAYLCFTDRALGFLKDD